MMMDTEDWIKEELRRLRVKYKIECKALKGFFGIIETLMDEEPDLHVLSMLKQYLENLDKMIKYNSPLMKTIDEMIRLLERKRQLEMR